MPRVVYTLRYRIYTGVIITPVRLKKLQLNHVRHESEPTTRSFTRCLADAISDPAIGGREWELYYS